MKKQIASVIFCCLLLAQQALAQGENPDFMRSIGKIYVVVAVIIAIFIGIILFLIYLERKVANLENLTNFKDNE